MDIFCDNLLGFVTRETTEGNMLNQQPVNWLSVHHVAFSVDMLDTTPSSKDPIYLYVSISIHFDATSEPLLSF